MGKSFLENKPPTFSVYDYIWLSHTIILRELTSILPPCFSLRNIPSTCIYPKYFSTYFTDIQLKSVFFKLILSTIPIYTLKYIFNSGQQIFGSQSKYFLYFYLLLVYKNASPLRKYFHLLISYKIYTIFLTLIYFY